MEPQKKNGRPFKHSKPLNIDIKVRIDEDTNKQLIEYAEKNGISRTDVIRKGIRLVLKSTK